MDLKTKKIILLSDGTGNSAASRDRSNVWRLYDALDLQREDQVAFYDDGVGSQEFMLFKILGGAFGYGLKRNVLELYKMLCRSYREGDSIYLFGFSRGAFTVRVLAGMIAACGLQTGVAEENELDRIARQNYNAFRAGFRQTLLSRLYRRIRRLGRNSISNARPDIQFVGVWDTVDAYGLPVDELSVLWDRYVFPIRFPDRDLSEKVLRGCHAVSVDDERLTFHPLLWNEAGEKCPQRIEQVWFAGVHADVGGGYPLDNLSLVSLDWMISRIEAGANAAGAAAAHRLHFIPAKREEIIRHADWHGVQHESRAGVAAYYRYKPRAVRDLCNDAENGVWVERPKIHRSVLERIRREIVHYLPTGLPADYAVVATRGPARQYEQQKEAFDRFEAMQPALDVIFWRRWLYGLLLATTVLFVGSRFYLDWTPGGPCVGSACALDPLLLSARAFLPDLAAGWIDAWRQNPTWLWAILFGFGFFSWLKYRAWRATQAHARAAWGPLKGRGRPGAGATLPAVPAGEPGMVRRFREKAHSDLPHAQQVAPGPPGHGGDRLPARCAVRAGSPARACEFRRALYRVGTGACRRIRDLSSGYHQSLHGQRGQAGGGRQVPLRDDDRRPAGRRPGGGPGRLFQSRPGRLDAFAASYRTALAETHGPYRRTGRRHLRHRRGAQGIHRHDRWRTVCVRQRGGIRPPAGQLLGVALFLVVGAESGRSHGHRHPTAGRGMSGGRPQAGRPRGNARVTAGRVRCRPPGPW